LPSGEPFYVVRRKLMINENKINYQMSVHILTMLKNRNMINEDEFTAIDMENKISFKVLEYQGLT